MTNTEAALWRSRAVSLRRAADAIDEMVEQCHEQKPRKPGIRARILDALCAAETMTAAQVHSVVGSTRNTVSTNLSRMCSAGMVERVSWGVYRLPEVKR